MYSFLIYRNDLPNISITLRGCADGVPILFQYLKNNNSTFNKIIEIFSTIKDWLQDHNLEINGKKTKIQQFKPWQKQQLNLNPLKNLWK